MDGHSAKPLRGEPRNRDVNAAHLRCEPIRLRRRGEVAQCCAGTARDQGSSPSSPLVKRAGTDHHHARMEPLHATDADAIADGISAEAERNELIVPCHPVLTRSEGGDGSLPLGVTCHPGTELFSASR